MRDLMIIAALLQEHAQQFDQRPATGRRVRSRASRQLEPRTCAQPALHCFENFAPELASCDAGPISSPQFSPDGKWISYSKDDLLLRPHVFVKALTGTNTDEHMIESEDFLSASGAKWKRCFAARILRELR